MRSFDETVGDFVTLCTSKGVIKKTSLDAYSNPRRGGIIAINLADDDELIAACRTNGTQEILIATKGGKSIRFPESHVRAMGRTGDRVCAESRCRPVTRWSGWRSCRRARRS